MKKKWIFTGAIFIFALMSSLIFIKLFPQSSKDDTTVSINEPITPTKPKAAIAPAEGWESLRWPVPPIIPVIKSSGNLESATAMVTKAPKRYLIKNPIKIKEVNISQASNEIKIELRYPQIEGLLDVNVQRRINEDLKDYAERLIKKSATYRKDLKEVTLYYNISANYNNVLCINLWESAWLIDDYIVKQETLLYELVDGKSLALKDVFSSSANFPELLNSALEENILKGNLEEQILKSPFKGIREGQNYELTDSRLTLSMDKNNEFAFNMMVYLPNIFTFRLAQFNGFIDIYDKFADPGREIYVSHSKKKIMLPNDMEEKFINIYEIRDNYRFEVYGRKFTGMKNHELEKKLNEICSYVGEEEFKKLLPKNQEKTNNINEMPMVTRNYHLTANYSDVICIESSIHYRIPGIKTSNSIWHETYNVTTGKKLQLQDLFEKNFDWKKSIGDFIRLETEKRNMKLEGVDINQAISKSDFWFDTEGLWLNLTPEIFLEDRTKNENVFFLSFEYLGDENLTIRE